MDAPLGSSGFEETGELKRLRRRAYGRDADIAGDAAAQARLSELEAAQHRPLDRVAVPEPVERRGTASTSVPEPVEEVMDEHAPAGGAVTEQDSPEGRIAGHDRINGAHATPWWRRRRGLVILGAAIAVLALNAALVAWLSLLLAQGSTPIPSETSAAGRPSVPYSDTRLDVEFVPDHVLALESVGVAADEPNDKHGTLDSLGIKADELRRYEDFQGLNVWSGESRFGITCLLVAVPGQGLREGRSTEGCAPEGLTTIAEFEGADSLTRFALRSDHVDVYVYVRADDPPRSQD